MALSITTLSTSIVCADGFALMLFTHLETLSLEIILLTNHESQESPHLPPLGRWDLHVDVDVEARLEGRRAEGGEGREVVGSRDGTQSLEVLLSRLEVSLPPRYLLWKSVIEEMGE